MPMAFTVADFHDLVRLLEEKPEWRAELRRLVLTDDVLGLPAAMQLLAERLASLTERVEALTEAQRRSDERLDVLTQRVDDLTQRLDTLTQRVEELTEAQRRTEQTVQRMDRQLGALRGDMQELRFRAHTGGYFGRLVRRARLVGDDELDALLESALESSAIDEDAADDLRLADLIVRGRLRDGPAAGQETYLVVDVSAGVGRGDVARAARRAAVLARFRPALAVVAGERATPDARSLAASRGVLELLATSDSDPDAG